MTEVCVDIIGEDDRWVCVDIIEDDRGVGGYNRR